MDKAQLKLNWGFIHRNIFLDANSQEEYDELTDQDYLDCVAHMVYFGALTPEKSGLEVLANCTMRCHDIPVAAVRWAEGGDHPMVEFGDTEVHHRRVRGDVYRITPDIMDTLDTIAGSQYIRSMLTVQSNGIHFMAWMYTKAEVE